MSFPGEYLLWYPASEGLDNTEFDRNIKIAKRAVEIGRWPRMRIFASPLTACHVITHLDISAVKNPHVTEWADSFREISESELPKNFGEWWEKNRGS